MAKIIVFGAGMVGSAMAKDLSANHTVCSVDFNPQNLDKLTQFGIKTIKEDLNNTEIFTDLVAPYDIVLNAVPGFMGFKTLEALIDVGKNIVDISFFPEDCFLLDEKAKTNNITVIVDFGVAPGIPNLLVGYHNRKMEINSYKCYVGGLPKERIMPFQYKAPFSPVDVIEEYTRPARFVEDGKIITKEALSDAELLNFEGIGTLEAFNTDGLRSLLFTNNIPNRIEKTLRYPGHIDLIKNLISAGFLSDVEYEYNGIKISARDFSSKILFKEWKLNEEDEEFTVMRIIFEGIEDSKQTKYVYNLYDEYNKETKISSMSRTTGYSATAVVNLILNGMYSNPGMNPPEFVGKSDEAVDFIFKYLEERGVIYKVEKEQK